MRPNASTSRSHYLALGSGWLICRLLVLLIGGTSLLVVSLPATPAALRLDPSLIGFGEVTAWLAKPRDLSFYLVEPLWRWDALAYVMVARDGYQAGTLASTAFPPLYPLAIRLVHVILPGQWLLGALLVSAAASLVAMLLLDRLGPLELGQGARLAPLLLLAAPTGFYLFAPYAESLCLALSLGALLAARSQRWWWAALLASLASLTKLHGTMLLVPLALLARQHGGKHTRAAIPVVAALLAPLIGPIVLELYSRLWLGDVGPLAQQTARWGWQIVVPGWPLVVAVWQLATQGVRALSEVSDVLLLSASLPWLIWGWRRLPPYLAWYTVAVMLPGLSRLMSPPLAANSRFLLLVFPLFLVMAAWARRPWQRVMLLGVSLAWQMLLLVLFVHWTWVA